MSFIWSVRFGYDIKHRCNMSNWRLRWAWPADGASRTLAAAGEPLMRQYADAGLDMMAEHATFEAADGSNAARQSRPVSPKCTTECAADAEEVFRGQNDDWLEEYATYHRKDGLLIKEGDNAISASRYALMMKRFGQTERGKANFNREIEYPKEWRAV
jgi:hypothetical protein